MPDFDPDNIDDLFDDLFMQEFDSRPAGEPLKIPEGLLSGDEPDFDQLAFGTPEGLLSGDEPDFHELS